MQKKSGNWNRGHGFKIQNSVEGRTTTHFLQHTDNCLGVHHLPIEGRGNVDGRGGMHGGRLSVLLRGGEDWIL